MGSSELFHSTPTPPPPLHWAGPLVFSFSCQAFHPADRYNVPESPCSSCSHAFSLADPPKKKIQGSLPRSPSSFFALSEKRSVVVEVWQRSIHCTSLRSCDPAGRAGVVLLYPVSVNAAVCQIKQPPPPSIPTTLLFFWWEPKWAEYETAALTQSTCPDYKARCSLTD